LRAKSLELVGGGPGDVSVDVCAFSGKEKKLLSAKNKGDSDCRMSHHKPFKEKGEHEQSTTDYSREKESNGPGKRVRLEIR